MNHHGSKDDDDDNAQTLKLLQLVAAGENPVISQVRSPF